MKNRSKSTYIGASGDSNLNKPNMKKMGEVPGIIEEEPTASAREKQEEKDLKFVNEGYRNANEEPESANVAKMIKQGVKATKPGAAPADRQFQPFKSPFTEEIINTSKEVDGDHSNKEGGASSLLSEGGKNESPKK